MSDIKASRDDQIYLIDTDVLAVVNNRSDSQRIYKGLIAMAEAMKLHTVRQVFDELKRFPGAYAALRAHRQTFEIPAKKQYESRVQEFIEILGNEMPSLCEPTGRGSNPDPADPWIVAVAATYRYTVVTNESQRSPLKIPAACSLAKIKCRCIHGPHFLYEVGMVKEFKPEHIDPAAFFRS